MVVKVYVSGISGNKEVKKRQQRVLMILESKNIKYEVLDIAEPGNEEHKDFMQNNSTSLGATVGDANPRHPLPPQLFNDSAYCGDYDQFDMANEIDELEKFLKTTDDSIVTSSAEIKLGNGNNEVEENNKESETISSTANEEETNGDTKNVSNEVENDANESNEVVTEQDS
nr:SH3 domain-binding glutamic acid-rich protein homolog [Onthophagus taurus]XP_022918913.1 SH3 domain-binding glutamic acid-rich protein homolog [Onthophagus taurus]